MIRDLIWRADKSYKSFCVLLSLPFLFLRCVKFLWLREFSLAEPTKYFSMKGKDFVLAQNNILMAQCLQNPAENIWPLGYLAQPSIK